MNEFIVTVNNKKKAVKILTENELKIGTKKYSYEISHINNNTYLLKCDNKYFEIIADRINNENFALLLHGNQFNTVVRTALQEKAISMLEQVNTSQNKQFLVNAPMPGMIIKIRKHEGDKIEKGESIMILEAMKMENDLKSPATGTLVKINVDEGKAVEKGAILFSIE